MAKKRATGKRAGTKRAAAKRKGGKKASRQAATSAGRQVATESDLDAAKAEAERWLDGLPKVFRRVGDRFAGRVVRRRITAEFAADALGEIVPGIHVRCLTMGKFSQVDVLEHLLHATGPADVMIATWTAGGVDLGFAYRMLADGRIRSLRFIVDPSFARRQPSYCAALREAFGDDAIRVFENHAKITVVRNEEWSLVVTTSQNFNENRRLEWLEVADDPEFADWIGQVFDDLFAFQKAGEGWEWDATAHRDRLGLAWGDGAEGTDGADSRFFGDGPTDVDLRRIGVSRRS